MGRIDKFILNAIAHARNSHYLIVYDIGSDGERNRVHDELKAWGRQIQFSVFECRITKNQWEELKARLENMNLSTGSIGIYKLDKQRKPFFTGSQVPSATWEEDEAAYVF